MAVVNNDIMGQYLQEIFSDSNGLKRFLEVVLNAAMKCELAEHLKAEDYQRSTARVGHRNGYKSRRLSTRVGQLRLTVPQARSCGPYHPSMFARFERSERALLVACAEMYFQGVSTRKVNDVLETMCSMQISSATVSRVAQELDAKLSLFCQRMLDEREFPYLQVDARYEKIRVEGKIVSQAVLVAVGIDTSGGREVLDWRICDSESQQSWGDMFKSLKMRGLKGLELVVSDAHEGIRSALQRYFQGVQWQRCRVHFKRELMLKVPKKLWSRLLAEVSAVYTPEERKQCLAGARQMADRWRPSYPRVAKMFEDGFEDTLSVCDLPEEIRRKMMSTNMVERIMKRLKARTRVVGVFPDRNSCWRLIGAQLLELHEYWITSANPYIGNLRYYYYM
jgi:putative transposase